MLLERPNIINEEFYTRGVMPEHLDELLADGWRHFGRHFFRYNFGIYEDEIRRVMPLRIRLEEFRLTKSLRRIARRNADCVVEKGPAAVDEEMHELFERHKTRFKGSIPGSLFEFVGQTAETPTNLFQVTVRCDERLLAASFFDLGQVSVSSIYGIFEPDAAYRGLGIFTMLEEIAFARATGKQYYYHGYAYEGESFYDYKKRFSALECFDWDGNWLELPRAATRT